MRFRTVTIVSTAQKSRRWRYEINQRDIGCVWFGRWCRRSFSRFYLIFLGNDDGFHWIWTVFYLNVVCCIATGDNLLTYLCKSGTNSQPSWTRSRMNVCVDKMPDRTIFVSSAAAICCNSIVIYCYWFLVMCNECKMARAIASGQFYFHFTSHVTDFNIISIDQINSWSLLVPLKVPCFSRVQNHISQ